MKDIGIENLYQSSKTTLPPKSLDNFILAQAKNSCVNNPYSSTSHRPRRWLFGISTAAVVVFSFTVVLHLQTDDSFNPKMPELRQKSEALSTTKPTAIAPHLSNADEQDSDSPEVDVLFKQKTQSPSLEKRQSPKPILDAPAAMSDDLGIDNTMTKKENAADTKTPIIVGSGLSEPELTEKKTEKQAQTYAETEERQQHLSASRSQPNPQTPAEKDENLVPQLEQQQNTELSLSQQLEQLDNLIRQDKIEQAKQLLIQLKTHYPLYDFSQYLKKLQAIE